MRHIEKKAKCTEFENYVSNKNLDIYLNDYINDSSLPKHPWKKISSRIKQKLSNHLYKEQQGLCIYCQQSMKTAFDNKFKTEISHIEHIKPKVRDKFPEETFNHNNLTLSCNGFDCNKDERSREFCGHNKHEEYSSDLFLNPVALDDIERYFEYTFEGEVFPADGLIDTEIERAKFMIDILDLNNHRLVFMRQVSYSEMIDLPEEDTQLLLDENAEILPSFYSMMKQLYISE